MGNTCFLNTVLQALGRCTPLKAFLLKDRTRTPATRPTTKKGPLVSAMQTFFTDVEARPEGTYKPTGVIAALLQCIRANDDDWYQPRQQADAAECIQYILDSLHDAVYRQVRITVHGDARTREQQSQTKALQSWAQFFAKEYSPIVENFYGQSQIQIRCETCGFESERYEPWLMLKVPIPGGDKVGGEVPTFEECVKAAFTDERISDYRCDECKSPQPAIIHTRISKLPNILILTFKRFTNAGAKIRGQIDWDLEALSLRQWLAFSRCPFADAPITGNFRTFAVIEHQGSSRGGHYRMFARHPQEKEENKDKDTDKDKDTRWLECDDETIRPTDVGNVISPDSYVIFAIPK